MSPDAEILAPRGRLSEAGPDPRRAALAVMLLAAFMNVLDVPVGNIARPTRRGHSADPASV
jgi:hypothetical protein